MEPDPVDTPGANRCLHIDGEHAVGNAELRASTFRELPVEWSWNGCRLKATADRYGMRPLFYAAWDNRIAISTSLCGVLQSGAPADLDEVALSVFLRSGSFLGNDTPFRYVRVLPPSGTLTWEAGDLEVRGSGPFIARRLSISRREAVDGYIEYFRHAIARRYAESFVLALSGGRDSRHITLELARQGRLPEFFVTSSWVPEQAPIADLIAARLGRPHLVVPGVDKLHKSERDKNARTNLAALDHAWFLPVARALSGNVNYDGIGGDVLSAGLFLEPWNFDLFQRDQLEALARRLLQPGNSSSIKIELPYEAAVARVVEELRLHREAPNPVGSFIFWNRTRRSIGASAFSLIPGPVYAPYLDADLWDFLSGLPAEMLLSHRFHDETIARAYPEFSDIPYAPKACNSFGPAPYAIAGLKSLLRPARYVDGARMSLRLLRSLLVPRFHVQMKGVFEQSAYLQQLSACSACALATGQTCRRATVLSRGAVEQPDLVTAR